MKADRAVKVVLVVCVAIFTTLLVLRAWTTHVVHARSAPEWLRGAEKTARDAGNLAGAVIPTVPVSGHALASSLHDESSAKQLSRLYSERDVAAAARAAANAADPAVWVQSLRLMFLCSDMRFTSLQMTAEQFRGPGDDDAKAQQSKRMMDEMRDMPAMNLAPPKPLRGMVAAYFQAFLANKETKIDPALEEKLNATGFAAMSPDDTLARDTLIKNTREGCKDHRFDYETYRAASVRWVAKGALGALIGNRQAGWTSGSLKELGDADYALVERAIVERQPDGVARILGGTNTWQLDLMHVDKELGNSAIALGFVGNKLVADLSLCQMGIADCGSNSPAFKEMCASIGGCHQPDLASLVRYALARDEIDATLIDQNVGRVVAAIYARDLAAIGIRKK
jgi:hypothetical protein